MRKLLSTITAFILMGAVAFAGPVGPDTNAGSLCSGATTYLNGETGCVDLSLVYHPLLGYTPVNQAGDTMLGDLNLGGNDIIGNTGTGTNLTLKSNNLSDGKFIFGSTTGMTYDEAAKTLAIGKVYSAGGGYNPQLDLTSGISMTRQNDASNLNAFAAFNTSNQVIGRVVFENQTGKRVIFINDVQGGEIHFQTYPTGGSASTTVATVMHDYSKSALFLQPPSVASFGIRLVLASATTVGGFFKGAASQSSPLLNTVYSTEASNFKVDCDGTVCAPALQDGGTRPTCNSAHRGWMWMDQAGASAADTVEICAKNSSDAYVWYAMATIP